MAEEWIKLIIFIWIIIEITCSEHIKNKESWWNEMLGCYCPHWKKKFLLELNHVWVSIRLPTPFNLLSQNFGHRLFRIFRFFDNLKRRSWSHFRSNLCPIWMQFSPRARWNEYKFNFFKYFIVTNILFEMVLVILLVKCYFIVLRFNMAAVQCCMDHFLCLNNKMWFFIKSWPMKSSMFHFFKYMLHYCKDTFLVWLLICNGASIIFKVRFQTTGIWPSFDVKNVLFRTFQI